MIDSSADILLVDDDRDWCELMEVLLLQSHEKFAVRSASTVQEALSLIESQSFDFYILDHTLPDGSGTEVCRKIRQSDLQTPIVFYSGMIRKIDRQTATEAGATEYLIKPNDLEVLTTMIGTLFNKTPGINQRPLTKDRDSGSIY